MAAAQACFALLVGNIAFPSFFSAHNLPACWRPTEPFWPSFLIHAADWQSPSHAHSSGRPLNCSRSWLAVWVGCIYDDKPNTLEKGAGPMSRWAFSTRGNNLNCWWAIGISSVLHTSRRGMNYSVKHCFKFLAINVWRFKTRKAGTTVRAHASSLPLARSVVMSRVRRSSLYCNKQLWGQDPATCGSSHSITLERLGNVN